MKRHAISRAVTTTVAAAAAAAFAATPVAREPDFSAFDAKRPWIVSRDLATRKIPIPGAVPETVFDETLVRPHALPDIFTSGHGAKVRTIADWEDVRRPELLELFRREVFGVAPPRPGDLAFRIVAHEGNALGGRAEFVRVAGRFALGGEPFTFHLMFFTPRGQQTGAPVFLLLNYAGVTAADPKSGSRSEIWPVEYAIQRGYAMAVLDLSAEIDPDRPNSGSGVRAFYRRPQAGTNAFTWGTIAAWAWGASRAADYLETDARIDPRRMAIIGHSRAGKTALWAGAQDTRFKLVVPNNAGLTGPSPARRRFGNTIEVMTGRNPHWFTPRYAGYARREGTMPFDQHMEIALVAPRGYHAGDGADDLWHDPRGAWLALAEASKVWTLYGRAKPLADPMPRVNDLLVDGPLAYHIRDGGHGLQLFDWKLYLDHADACLGSGIE